MAKSLRSKWRRKCRAVKRERYSQKELERLKKTLGIDDDNKGSDVAMAEITEVATVTDIKKIKEEKSTSKNEEDVAMNESTSKVFNTKTLRDKNGAYPIWVHPRKIKKVKRINKKCKSKSKKKK